MLRHKRRKCTHFLSPAGGPSISAVAKRLGRGTATGIRTPALGIRVGSAPRRLVRDPSPRAGLLRIRTRECQPVSARVGPPDPSDVAARLQRAGRSVPSDGCLMVVLVKPDARPVKNEIPLPPAPPPPPPTVRPSPSPTRAGAGTSSRSCPYASPPPPLRRRPPGARWRPAAVAARAARPNRATRVRALLPARRGADPTAINRLPMGRYLGEGVLPEAGAHLPAPAALPAGVRGSGLAPQCRPRALGAAASVSFRRLGPTAGAMVVL
jgi:hypothetical protein